MSRAIRMLFEKGRITREQFDQATLLRAKYGETVGYHLVELNIISDHELVEFFLSNFLVPHWPRSKLERIPPEIIDLVSADLARHLRILPLGANEHNLTLGLTDPSLTHVAEEASFHTKKFINPILVSESDMTWALSHYYNMITVPPLKSPNKPDTRPINLVTHRDRQTMDMGRVSHLGISDSVDNEEDIKHRVVASIEGWGYDSWAEGIPEKKPASLEEPPEESEIAPQEDRKPTSKISIEDLRGVGQLKTTLQPVPRSVTRKLAKQHARLDKKKKKSATELLEAIHNAEDRDQVIDATLDYLLQFSTRAAFLVVRKDKIQGHDIKGEFTSKSAIQSYWVPVTSESTFQRVKEDCTIHLGPLGHSASDAVFAAALGGRPGRILVIPVEIGNRVIGLIYADGLHVEMPPWNHLERLADVMGINLARIILEREKG